MSARAHILFIERDAGLRSAVSAFLGRANDVTACATWDEVRERLFTRPDISLFIASVDLAEPDECCDLYSTRGQIPNAPVLLLTHDLPDTVLRDLERARIYNVLPRTAISHDEDLSTVVENLIHPPRAFGLERHLFKPEAIHRFPLRSTHDKRAAVEQIAAYFRRFRSHETDVHEIRLAIEEMINNSIYHGFKDRATGAPNYQLGVPLELEENHLVEIEFGRDRDHFGCLVRDSGGTMDPSRMLDRLARQASLEGLMDTSGRGLYLARNLSDRMIVNIHPGRMTEVVLLFSERRRRVAKPLLFNVVRTG